MYCVKSLIEGREPSRLFTFISEPSELNPFEELRELLTREPPPRKLIAVEARQSNK